MKRFQKIRAKWRICTLPDNRPVWKGEGRGSVAIDLDIGKYVWIVHHNDGNCGNGFKYRGEVLNGVTDDQWRDLRNMRPTIAKPVFVTAGMVWRCQFVGCSDEHTSRLSAVLHEADHQGINLLESPELESEVKDKMSEYAEKVSGKVEPKRGPGRPGKRTSA